MSIYEVAINAVYVIPVALLFLIVYSIKVARNTIYKYIILSYLTICLLFDLAGHILGTLYSNNLILIPCFGVLELICFSILYVQLTKHRFCYIITIPTIMCFFIELINFDYLDALNFQSYIRFLSSFTVVLLSIFYFFMLLKNKWKKYNFPLFLLNSCLLVYSSFSSLYYLPINLLINWSSQAKFWFWMVNMVLTLIFYIVNTKVICSLGKKK